MKSPKATCPKIDEAIELVENSELCNYEKVLLNDILEQVRSDNSKLREWGEELQEALNEIARKD